MFGDDHRWEDAKAVYAGLDAAIAAMNRRTSNTSITFQYSTPVRSNRSHYLSGDSGSSF